MKCYNCNEEITGTNTVTAYTPYDTKTVCIDCGMLIRDGRVAKPLITREDYDNLPDCWYLPEDAYLIAKLAQDVFLNLDVDTYTKRIRARLNSSGTGIDCRVLFDEIRALLLSGVPDKTDEELERIYEGIKVCALEILTDISDSSKDTEACILDALYSLRRKTTEKFPTSSVFNFRSLNQSL